MQLDQAGCRRFVTGITNNRQTNPNGKRQKGRLRNDKCDEALATPLSHSAFSGSSVFTTGYAPGYAKLNRRGGAGGWSPLDTDHYPWLQVDLGSRKQVTAIATQGRYSSSDWTTHYRLLYSDMGRNWKPYHQDGNIWVFTGNSNTESVVRHDLQHSIVARYLRFVPLGWSEEGQIGLRIEIYGCSYWADVIHFDGQGVISYRFKMKKMKILKDVIALKFKTGESDGVILHGEGQQGDYITLELRKGKLLLQINLGSNQYGSILGHTSVSSGSLLDDHHWHSVVIERYRRNVNFTLDQHTQHFRTNGEFDHLDLDYEARASHGRQLNFGGMPYSGKPNSGGQRNFIGCMESINYNGENITDLARRRKLDTSSFRNLTFSCVDPHTFPVFFNATSFLQLPGRREHNMVSVSFQFRTWNANGLLLFSTLADGMLELVLKDGKVMVHISVLQLKSSQVDLASGSGLNDGEWHDVRFLAKENFAMLTIDGDESLAVKTNALIHITTGGLYHFGDVCPIIVSMEEGALRPGTPSAAPVMAVAVYEQSCEAYKHLGKTSDVYWIDPDGSGPLGPFRVICNMTEDKVWTVVVNSLPAQTTVSGSSRERRTVLHVNYSATVEQISAITDAAEHCEQHIAYTCRSSRLLNTPGRKLVHVAVFRTLSLPHPLDLFVFSLRISGYDLFACPTTSLSLRPSPTPAPCMDPAAAAAGGHPSQDTSPPTYPVELRGNYRSAMCADPLVSRSDGSATEPATKRECRHTHARPASTVRALDWASAVWDADPQIRMSFTYFAGMIQEYPAGGKDISLQLMELRQGSDSAAYYAIKFRTLAAQSGWNDAALWAVFCEGLSPALQTELACWEDATSLSQYVATAIRLAISCVSIVQGHAHREHLVFYVTSSPCQPCYPGLFRGCDSMILKSPATVGDLFTPGLSIQ
ncbi:hypothetical protein QTP70_013485 [Hemibagrus guttatus]|uniref:Contactin-associated protein-like 2 n=1 Tax=Hemibagrus guttatus TaxID=175788 RepID=A0AAE0Q7Z5_9TELE|nr:hypothetical protein QTP70_013485 [Hemibagrus guttatus]